jgi:hypothetical protein
MGRRLVRPPGERDVGVEGDGEREREPEIECGEPEGDEASNITWVGEMGLYGIDTFDYHDRILQVSFIDFIRVNIENGPRPLHSLALR